MSVGATMHTRHFWAQLWVGIDGCAWWAPDDRGLTVLLAGYSTASPAERAHVNATRMCRIIGASTLVCAIYAAVVALLVYAYVLGTLDRTALFLVAGIGAIVPVAALCGAGYRANMGTYA